MMSAQLFPPTPEGKQVIAVPGLLTPCSPVSSGAVVHQIHLYRFPQHVSLSETVLNSFDSNLCGRHFLYPWATISQMTVSLPVGF